MKRIFYGILLCYWVFPLGVRAGDEVGIDFDSLEEAPQAAASIKMSEPVEPVRLPEGLEKNARWMLTVLAILVPAASMLFPVRRIRRPSKERSPGNEMSPEKES